jgi:hypothetical protein
MAASENSNQSDAAPVAPKLKRYLPLKIAVFALNRWNKDQRNKIPKVYGAVCFDVNTTCMLCPRHLHDIVLLIDMECHSCQNNLFYE